MHINISLNFLSTYFRLALGAHHPAFAKEKRGFLLVFVQFTFQLNNNYSIVIGFSWNPWFARVTR